MTATDKGRSYDLAVIGSGGAAFAAAIRATTLGKRVVMIERGTIGGTRAAAEARHVTLDAARFPGLPLPDAPPVDMPAMVAGKDKLVGSLRSEKYAALAAEYGWALHPGEATFVGTPTEPALRVTGPDGTAETVRAAHPLIATGSTPWAPPVPGLQEAGYLTSTTAMELDHVPESLLVIGGGYVAMEQAQLFSRLGAQVTMLVRSRLASHEEPEAATARGAPRPAPRRGPGPRHHRRRLTRAPRGRAPRCHRPPPGHRHARPRHHRRARRQARRGHHRQPPSHPEPADLGRG